MRKLANEPALVVAVILGSFSAGSSFFLDLGAAVPWETALGKALGLFGLAGIAGGTIRQLVYGPRTVDDVMDAHAVIESAERGEHA